MSRNYELRYHEGALDFHTCSTCVHKWGTEYDYNLQNM